MEEEIEYTDVPVGAIVTALIAGIVGTLGIKKIVKIRKARRLKKDRELVKFTEEYAEVMERAARRLERMKQDPCVGEEEYNEELRVEREFLDIVLVNRPKM